MQILVFYFLIHSFCLKFTNYEVTSQTILHIYMNSQIVRPGGMERPTDAFKETHNLTLSPDDTLFGGLVSNLQVS